MGVKEKWDKVFGRTAREELRRLKRAGLIKEERLCKCGGDMSKTRVGDEYWWTCPHRCMTEPA